MIYPSETVSKRYYYVQNSVVYNIKYVQDSDGCGVLPGFVNGELPTEKIPIYTGIKDDTLKDAEGNEIKTTVVKDSSLSGIYPNICIKYKRYVTKDDGTKTIGTHEFTKYLWLDKLIDDGDKYASNKFSIGATHNTGDINFKTRFERFVKEDIAQRVLTMSSVSAKTVRRYYPFYLRDVTDADDAKYTTIDGWTVEIQSVTIDGVAASNLFTDTELNKIVEDYAKQKALEAANAVVKKINKIYTSCTLS